LPFVSPYVYYTATEAMDQHRTTFVLDNIRCTVESTDRTLYDALDSAFSYFVHGAQYTKAYKLGKWDGYRHLFNMAGRTFPSGLLSEAVEIAKRRKHEVEVIDKRDRPEKKPGPVRLVNVEPRDYQKEAVEAAISASRGVIWHPTGSGKTVTMAAIISSLGLPALVLVDQAWIAKQTHDRFVEWFPDKRIGLVTGLRKRDGDIVCATFQSLAAQKRRDKDESTSYLKQWLAKFDVLCIDEAHHTRASVYQSIINLCPAYYRFGFSATPLRSTITRSGEDKSTRLHLIGSTGPVIDVMAASEGVEAGILTPARVHFLRWHPDRPYSYWRPEDFEINDRLYSYGGRKTMKLDDGKRVRLRVPLPGLYEVGIVNHHERNLAIAEAVSILYHAGHTILVLVSWVEHGNVLKPLIEQSIGEEIIFVRGENPQKERELVKYALRYGHRRVCLATSVFDEGVDVPEISALVYARGGRAQYKVIQAIGRGMRIAEGKKLLEVVDFLDTHSRILYRHSQERLKAYKSDSAYRVSIVDELSLS
jgi:superfamily II DNA or RNA helicase